MQMHEMKESTVPFLILQVVCMKHIVERIWNFSCSHFYPLPYDNNLGLMTEHLFTLQTPKKE